jgi:hypothetical protein
MLIADPNNGDLTMDRGDYFDPEFTITDQNGNPLDVTGASFKLTVKASLDDAIGAAVFQLTSGASQFDLSGAASGVVKALGPEALTQGLAGDYTYDLEMVLSGKTRTVQKAALLRIDKDVTTPGTLPDPPVIGILFPSWVAFPDFLYWKDQADSKWVKFRLYNRNMEYVSESVNPPPF